MSGKIAIEGLKQDATVPLVHGILSRYNEKYSIVYFNQSAYIKVGNGDISLQATPEKILENILKSKPDLTILCNARGYFPGFMELYASKTDMPLITITGGGPALEDKVKKYTPHVIGAPFSVKDLYRTLDNILLQRTKAKNQPIQAMH